MDDFAQEIEASFSNFRDADMEIWDKLEQMKEDKEAFEVTIEGIVKAEQSLTWKASVPLFRFQTFSGICQRTGRIFKENFDGTCI